MKTIIDNAGVGKSNKNSSIQFQLIEAEHYGMCFGVKAAINKAQQLAEQQPVTILGELAHNSTVKEGLEKRGANHASLEDTTADTEQVIITAHGAADRDRKRWQGQGYRVLDTTCPLVHKAHDALKSLVKAGYIPIVIGQSGHVEVKGLTGDFPQAQTILSITDVEQLSLEYTDKIGIISQTTQQLTHVEEIVKAVRERYPQAEVKFVDTICRPTKERQVALLQLCAQVELVIVVGGVNSNNTAQLANKCRTLGCAAYHVQSPHQIQEKWFKGVTKVGLTAGTSTPDSDIEKVKTYLLHFR